MAADVPSQGSAFPGQGVQNEANYQGASRIPTNEGPGTDSAAEEGGEKGQPPRLNQHQTHKAP